MLNRAEPFFALTWRARRRRFRLQGPGGGRLLSGPARRSRDPDRASAARLVALEVELSDGSEYRGRSTFELPPSRARALDYVNTPGGRSLPSGPTISPGTSTSRSSASSVLSTETDVARLDRLIQVMHEQRADALQLARRQAGFAACRTARLQPVTREPLTETQILGSAPRDRVPRGRGPAGSAPGRFVRLPVAESARSRSSSKRGKLRRPLRPAAAGLAARGGRRPAQPPRSGPARRLRIWPSPRTRWSALLRRLVESGASDLHLRTGESADAPQRWRAGPPGRSRRSPAERLEPCWSAS